MNGQSLIGDWIVNWDAGWITRRKTPWKKRQYPDARLLLVLQLLAGHRGRTLSTDELLEQAWPERVVSRDSVSTAIYQLRQLLGDDSQQPSYIKTEGRRGYRLVANIEPVQAGVHFRQMAYVLIAGLFVVGGVSAFHFSQEKQAADIPLYIEALNDMTQAKKSGPLHKAIETTLRGELTSHLPGRVTTVLPDDDAALMLQSAIVDCDRGPALVVNLVDIETERHLWSGAYPMNPWEAREEGPTMVQKVALDVSTAILAF